MNELTARLDDWCLVFVGNPIDGYVLIGRVSPADAEGHGADLAVGCLWS